jgi:hypothetical protein
MIIQIQIYKNIEIIKDLIKKKSKKKFSSTVYNFFYFKLYLLLLIRGDIIFDYGKIDGNTIKELTGLEDSLLQSS